MLDDNDVLQLDYLEGGVGSLITFLSIFLTIFLQATGTIISRNF